MRQLVRLRRLLVVTTFLAFLAAPAIALAKRSGASFGGRGGFRSSPSSFSRSYSSGRTSSPAGPNVVVMPGFGWGWGFLPFMGGGGGSLLGSVIMLGVLGLGAALVVRAFRRAHRRDGGGPWGARHDHDDDHDAEVLAPPGRAYVYKIQLGLGRSARGIQKRLEAFAAEGDTSSEAGLASLVQQTALELLREKHSIRYGEAQPHGPMNLQHGETKLNALALAERSRFEVERVRGADGKVRRAEAAGVQSADALEYLLVTIVLATRTPLASVKPLTDREQLDEVLAELGGVSPSGLLGLEVIWTPADPEDALTENDLLAAYPNLRSL
jgi:uncharacterized membrane protein